MGTSRRGNKPQRSGRRTERNSPARPTPQAPLNAPEPAQVARRSEWKWWPVALGALVAALAGGVWLHQRDNEEKTTHESPLSEEPPPPEPEPPWGRVERPGTLPLPALPATPAPWGEIERSHLAYPQPPGYTDTQDCVQWRLAPWQFSGYTRDRLQELFTRATPDVELRARMLNMAECSDTGCVLMPTLELQDALDSHAHAVIYDTLAAWPENTYQVLVWRRHQRFGPWHAMPGLSDHARHLLAQSTWLRRDEYLFADIPWVCARLQTEAERLRFIEVIRTRYGISARVKVNASSNLDGLVAWWSRGTSTEHVRALFQAAMQAPGGGSVPMAELLPPMVRRRLGSFPTREEPLYDCFWTALHFFGDTPTALLPGPDGFKRAIETEYEPVPFRDLRFGDVILLTAPDGTIIHAVNHVADDLVLTKNGGYYQQAWLLASLDDVRSLYPQGVEMRPMRLRAAPAPR